jgi:hypothetical protein
MIVYSLLLLTVLGGLIAMLLVVKPLHWSRLVLALSLGTVMHLYGAWVYLSFYLKYAFDAVFLLAMVIGLMRRHHYTGKRFPGWRIGLNVSPALIFTTLSVLYFTGTRPAPEIAQLHFPFKAGQYFILQGGRGLPSNFFHGSSGHGIYAVDIVRLNNRGQRCSEVFSKRLENYFIFGDTVYSPCAGVVKRTIADNPDNTPPDRTRGPHNLNNVLIEGEQHYVFLGHLKYESVFVKVGDIVQAGTPLGLAGNSGFTIEPHLHLQVHRKVDPALPWYTQPPVYPSFDGREYHLFERVIAVAH